MECKQVSLNTHKWKSFWELESFECHKSLKQSLRKQTLSKLGLFRLLKRFWIIDRKMGSHSPFGESRHKVWLKEWMRVKLVIWFMTMKTWKTKVKWFQLELVT